MKTTRAVALRVVLGSIVLSMLAAAAINTASAAPITWGSAQNITGDSDVSTSGTLLYAYNFGTYSVSTTINGVQFAPFALPIQTNPTVPVTVGSVSISESTGFLWGDFVDYGSTNSPFSGLTNAYKSLLETGASASAAGTITLLLGGLTVGQQYDFQWWTNNSSTAGNFDRTIASAGSGVTLATNTSGAGVNGGVGQYAIGRFTADSTSQSIDFDAIGEPLINGFQVRLAPSAVPEIDPAGMGSVLALVTGALGLLERRRMKTA